MDVGGTEDTEAMVNIMEDTVEDTMGDTTAVTMEDIIMAGAITEVITVVIIAGFTHFFGELRYGAGPIILAGLIPTMRDRST